MSLVEIHHTEPGIAELVLNRPEKANALNADMLDEFAAAVAELGADQSIRVVVLRGEGRHFCAGYDVAGKPGAKGGYSSPNIAEDWTRLRRNLERWMDIWDLDKPVIAAVQGTCAGGASMLCVCADMVVVADDAKIAWPTLPLGGGLLSPVNLWVIGMRKARELSYIIGSSISGKEAQELGWANRSVPADEVLEQARDLARQVAKTPASLLRLKKLAINRVMEVQGFRTSFFMGAEWDAIAHDVHEHHTVREQIQDLGLQQAIEWFNAGGLEDADKTA